MNEKSSQTMLNIKVHHKHLRFKSVQSLESQITMSKITTTYSINKICNDGKNDDKPCLYLYWESLLFIKEQDIVYCHLLLTFTPSRFLKHCVTFFTLWKYKWLMMTSLLTRLYHHVRIYTLPTPYYVTCHFSLSSKALITLSRNKALQCAIHSLSSQKHKHQDWKNLFHASHPNPSVLFVLNQVCWPRSEWYNKGRWNISIEYSLSPRKSWLDPFSLARIAYPQILPKRIGFFLLMSDWGFLQNKLSSATLVLPSRKRQGYHHIRSIHRNVLTTSIVTTSSSTSQTPITVLSNLSCYGPQSGALCSHSCYWNSLLYWLQVRFAGHWQEGTEKPWLKLLATKNQWDFHNKSCNYKRIKSKICLFIQGENYVNLTAHDKIVSRYNH